MDFKYILGLALFCITLQLEAMEARAKPEQVEVICKIKACGGNLQLFEFDGAAFKPLLAAREESDSLYSFTVPKSEPAFYYLGNEATKVKPIILGPEEEVIVRGACGQEFELAIEKSKINKDYIALKSKMNRLRRQHSGMIRKFRSAADNEERKKLAAELRSLDEKKLALLEETQKVSPYLASIVAVNTYLSFQNSKEKYPNEVFYFAETFFKFADLTDESYNRSSWLFEAMKGYTYTLSAGSMDKTRHQKYLDGIIDRIPEKSKARKLAMSGAIVVLSQRNHANFVPIAERFIAEYKEVDPKATADLQKQVDRIKPFMLGGVAPDFTQNSPGGEQIKLSDFRGKVLLVDFWASWCGPCRRENPHVVSLYKKYKEQGFEILGVSLDSNRDRWLNAIDKDQLEWHHVSDLKGWKNAVAKMYNVSSIPHTILLDAEGKIIARNLRGDRLERKLEELFD